MAYKTIRVTGGVPISLGRPQVQPTIGGSHIFTQNVYPVSSLSKPLPIHEISAGAHLIDVSGGELNLNSHNSVAQISNLLINNNNTLFPTLYSHGPHNQILPVFALHLQLRNVSTIKHNVSDRFVNSGQKFEPYEKLNNISQERPEIIMLTSFLPLFENESNHSHPSSILHIENAGYDAYLTPAGHLLKINIQTVKLRWMNAMTMIQNISKRSPHVKKQLKSNYQVFEKSIHDLNVDVEFLLELIKLKETSKRQLDIRNSLHVTNSENAIHKLTAPSGGEKNRKLDTTIDLSTRMLPVSYTPSEILIRLGYDSNHIKNYSSTKIWLQTLQELKDILRYHSLEFLDLVPARQKRDESNEAIIKNATEFFTFNEELTSLLHVKDFFNIASNQVNDVLSAINGSWNILYRNVHFSSPEVKIAALINLISKEYRYCVGLTEPTTQRALSEFFSYEIQTVGNNGLFDNVIGEIGNNAFNISAKQTKSLANISHIRPSENIEVSTFETNYANSANGSLTPGGVFFIDSVLNDTDGQTFNTSKLDDLTKLLNQTFLYFTSIVHSMNFTGSEHSMKADSGSRKHANIIENPQEFVRTLIGTFIDLNNGNTKSSVTSDVLCSVFALASQNTKIKSILFTLMMLKISRQYHSSTKSNPVVLTSDNTPTTDVLIDKLLTELIITVKNNISTKNGSSTKNSSKDKIQTTQLTGAALKLLLKANKPSDLMLYVMLFMTNISASFDAVNTTDGFTRFSNVSDTSIMITAFDILVQVIAKYSNESFTSVSVDPHGQPTFTVTITHTNNKESANFLIGRIDKESSLIIQVITSILNSLEKLTKSTQNFSGFLHSPNSTKTLQKMSETLQDNDLLKMLISEQQTYMLASTLQDFLENIQKRHSSILEESDDIDNDGDIDSNDALKIIDDSVISPVVRNALFGFFGSDQYTTKKGNNKKILTIGMPLGFANKLQQKALNEKHPLDKQTDIIQLVVYKIDVQNSDIVYKPQRFYFELSRFPVRNDRLILPLPQKPSLNDVIEAIPTRDLGDAEHSREPQYFTNRPGKIPAGHKVAMTSLDYSFLTQQQKSQIIRNHIVSYLLEVYTKLLTGISLGDYDFDMIDHPRPMNDQFVKLIGEHHISLTVEKLKAHSQKLQDTNKGGVLFSRTSGLLKTTNQKRSANSSGTAGSVDTRVQFDSIKSSQDNTRSEKTQNVTGNIESDLSQVSHRDMPLMLHGLRTLSSVANMSSTMGDPKLIVKRLLSPKQFDRVFNLIIDPDEFEIDYEKTISTELGKAALQQLINNGEIIIATENDVASTYLTGGHPIPNNSRSFVQNRLPRETHNYRFRNRDKNEGDVTIEKYFVSIETFEEGNKV